MTRKPTREELEQKVEELYRLHFEPVSDVIYSIDRDFKILIISPSVEDVLGYRPEELIGKRLQDLNFLAADSLGRAVSDAIRVLEGERIESRVYEFIARDGTVKFGEVSSAPLKGAGSVIGVVSVARDITARKRAEEALRKSEETLRTILDASIDRIRQVDEDMRILWANETTTLELGMSPEDIKGRTCHELFVGRDTPCDGCPTLKARDTKEIERGVIYKSRVRGIEGDSYWDCYAVPIKDKAGDLVSIVQVARNITDQKRSQDQIHMLSQQIMEAQESERQMISRELHDHVAQDLSALKIEWDMLLKAQSVLPSEVMKRLSAISNSLQGTINTVRDISYDLRPPGLDHMGIVQTIFQYCEEFSERTGLKVEFSDTGMNGLRIDYHTAINLYRLVQEGLNNIWKHAEASHATIRMISAYPNILLRIEDDGKGFDIQKRLAAMVSEKRMGLRSMEERVKLLGGEMKLSSRLGLGTKILIKIPAARVKHESKENHINSG